MTKRTKQFDTAIKADGPRKFTFTISTGDVDREKDTVSCQGWDLTAYRRNPVVMWAHRYDLPPVAKASAIGVVQGTLVATIEFPEPGTYEFADQVRGLLEQDFLRATSVGFRPLTWKFNEARGGVDFESQELLEFSIVPVPANPHCLITPTKSYDRAKLGAFLGVDLDDEVIDLDSIDCGLAADEQIDVTPADVRAALSVVIREQVTRAMPGAQVVDLSDDVLAGLTKEDVAGAMREALTTVAAEHVSRAVKHAMGRID